MRYVLALSFALLPIASAALAQDSPPRQGFSPLSGPNNPVPSPVCALINFGFCPQPAEPPPAFPDPEADAAPPPRALPAATTRHHHRTPHRVRVAPDAG